MLQRRCRQAELERSPDGFAAEVAVKHTGGKCIAGPDPIDDEMNLPIDRPVELLPGTSDGG
jgi:hypothetical protein